MCRMVNLCRVGLRIVPAVPSARTSRRLIASLRALSALFSTPAEGSGVRSHQIIGDHALVGMALSGSKDGVDGLVSDVEVSPG